MNILLIYPEKENTTKGFEAFFQKLLNKPTEDPRALIEISIQLPITWERKLLDLNQEKLNTKDLQWADYVIIKADLQQRLSTVNLIEKCKLAGKKIIAEGELFDTQPNDFENVDHLILNQATFDPFVRDVESNTTRRIYSTYFRKEKLRQTAYSLLGFSGYFSRNIHPFSA
ncbi:hypothetical protein [Draconibacterium halophilum]|uniref:Uncharacterized protein n=1 Tax=Draconibacterium halophilum TaxID=2706887 RepID=A0A6C0R9F3_9BACT|nr:hypothetical protein [Draconibacterium halophilum]QIA06295.1 hypothetical protein G0Q07_00455 [Draconibacterium halophilum]